MRLARLLPIALLAVLALVGATTSVAALSSPTGLHGFLLRADEPAPAGNSFPRTPAFAWDPVPGASGYEFQLSTSRTFNDGDSTADNAVFYDTNTLTSPVVSPPLVLPWITGAPHALYARVRATTADGVTPWSASYGFDLGPRPSYPTPLSTQGDPGLLRWSPIEGADAYQVWLVDLPNGGKIVKTRTNVLDEREFYTFHGSQQWIGKVRWRVRAVRSIEGGTPANHFPVSTFGQWSPIYQSTNPALATGALKLVNTISDVVENGAATHSEPAHRLMPAFTWSGDTVTLPNATTVTTELFRVEVFSDRQCLNMVYSGPVVGGQSWAPRAFGGSPQLPSPSGLTNARQNFPSDGGQGSTLTYDAQAVSSVEDLGPASATTAPPPDAIPSGASQAVTTPPDLGTFPPVAGTASVGAPVDLWDTYWPDSGYYWTVMPVAPALAASNGTVAAPGASKGSTIVPVNDTSRFATNEIVTIGVAPNSDTATVVGVGNGLLTLSAPLNVGHIAGDPVVVLGGAGGYQDVMLPEDLCGQAGMRHELGIWSEPTVASPQAPFATGLSSTGKLISATPSAQFYGRPLVAWTPALRAEKYEIEWSKTEKPFVAVGNMMTVSTSAVLPLATGDWYYRIRGFDYNLPTGAQQMAWSDVESLTVAQPLFKVVQGSTKKGAATKQATPTRKAAPKTSTSMKRIVGNGLTIDIPKDWTLGKDGSIPVYENAAKTLEVGVLMFSADYATQAAAVVANYAKHSIRATATSTTLPAGATKVVTAKRTDAKGAQWTDRSYIVADGTGSRAVIFSGKGSAYAAGATLFAKIAASLRLGG